MIKPREAATKSCENIHKPQALVPAASARKRQEEHRHALDH
jgi:hypothetical protein